MNKLWIVIQHEFKMTVMNKSFIIFTILAPFLIVMITVLPSLIIRKAEKKTQQKEITIGIVNYNNEIMNKISDPLKKERIILKKMKQTRKQLDSLVKEGELYGYLILPDNILKAESIEIVSKKTMDYKITRAFRRILGQYIVNKRMRAQGFDPKKIKRLTTPPRIIAIKLTKKGGKVKQDFFASLLSGITFVMILYMTILLYGQSIGRSVLLEKTSKTVEIILSSIKPIQLLIGKVVGGIFASLLQYGVWISIALLFIRILGPRMGLSSLPEIPNSIFIYMIIYYILGFFLYSTIYAAFGAASEDQTNFQQISAPLIMFLLIPIMGGSFFLRYPHSSVSVFLSFFPMTSPIVMFTRILGTKIPAWQIIASILILIITIGIVFKVSAKIFRIGILMTGKKFKLKEIIKWIRL